jgi:hypothetical protein
MEKTITALEKKDFLLYARKLIVISIIFLMLSILFGFVFYRYENLESEKIFGLIIGLVIGIGYVVYNMYMKSKEINLGLKIEEQIIVVSVEKNIFVTFFLLSNKLNLYSDTLKRSKLRKTDIKVGMKLNVSFLPISKYIISVEIVR